jgi:hypothetical protein
MGRITKEEYERENHPPRKNNKQKRRNKRRRRERKPPVPQLTPVIAMGHGYNSNARGYRSVPKQGLVDNLRHQTLVVIVPERGTNDISSAAVPGYETGARPTAYEEAMTNYPVTKKWIPSRDHRQLTSRRHDWCYDGDGLLHRAIDCPDGHEQLSTNYRLLLCQKFPGAESVEEGEVVMMNKDVNAGAVMRRILWEYVRYGQRPDWNMPPS